MNSLVVLVALFVLFGAVLAFIAFLAYRRVLRRAKGIERGLKMVPLLIHLPPSSDDTESGSRPMPEVMREKVNQAQVLYDLIAGTAQSGFKSNFYGQRHISFEIVASGGLVHYFAAVPIALVEVVEQAIVTAYPGARLEEVEDHNIFNPQGRLTATVGGELVLKHEAAYPIGVIESMERDPMEALINSLYKLQLGDGAAVQVMVRPARPNWTKRSINLVAQKRHNHPSGIGFSAADLAKAAVKAPSAQAEQHPKEEPSKLEEQMLQAIEDKTKHPGYEVLVRVLASSSTYARSQIILRNLVNAFSLFEAPGSNGFQFIEGRDMQGLVTAFIFRFFPPELVSTVLNSVELAALFHLPDAQFTATTQVERQQSKQVDGPINMPTSGLLLGYNFYRGVKKEIRLSAEDRRRHAYIVGQTGTGKSTMLENLAVQDMLAGNGFAFIDPHGDTAEKLLSMVPKERAEDVIYFNPGDMEHPLGLNIFEYSSPEQKDFLVQEAIGMLYKLYDPGKTGMIGPRFEHWFRNAALTLMADPHGASFIELPKVFTDAAYLKNKFQYLTDPSVIEFWTKEMGQTSDFHKSEMLGWFVSKFGAFQSNEMMRNIIGQTKSGFNIRDIMDNKKILIVNLSKGRVGELNSQLLGMIFVIKIQAAAMSRANVPEDQRSDFCLYVDEFQNFSTDSFAAILSEARKYRLNLIVANQFIGQLTDEIRDAVFGNIGSIMSYRTGPEDAEFLVKQFQPIFDQRDLVNLPNHNAVMKLLIGGLPSQPFSITALPPLGIAHPEMGLAIQQLSAAKYGVARNVVETDIFARLQNQPTTVAPNAATAALTPSVAAPVTAVMPAPPLPAPAPVAPTPPVPFMAASPEPPPVAAPVVPTSVPLTASSPDHAALLPAQAPAAAPAPAAPPTPPPALTPVPPPPVKPSASSPTKAATGSIADIVKASPPPVPASPKPAPAPIPAPPPSVLKPPPVAAPMRPPVPSHQVALPAPPPRLQIEAHEADGHTNEEGLSLQSLVNPTVPAVVPSSPPKPSVASPPVPAPAPPPVIRSSPPLPLASPQPQPTPRPAPVPPARPLPPPPPKPQPPSVPKLPPPPKPAVTQPAVPSRPPTLPPPAPLPPKPASLPPRPPAPNPIPQAAPPPPRIPHQDTKLVPAPPKPPQPKPQSPVPPLPKILPPPPKPTIPAPISSKDDPVVPSVPMVSTHIELHHHHRASEDPGSTVAQKALAGQEEVVASAPDATPSTPSSSPSDTPTAVTNAYIEAAVPKASLPQPEPFIMTPDLSELEDSGPVAAAPRPGEVVAPHASAASTPSVPPPTPSSSPKPQPKPQPSEPKPPVLPPLPEPPVPPKPAPAMPKLPPLSKPPQPKPLQPGEIYVDASGEVVQG